MRFTIRRATSSTSSASASSYSVRTFATPHLVEQVVGKLRDVIELVAFMFENKHAGAPMAAQAAVPLFWASEEPVPFIFAALA